MGGEKWRQLDGSPRQRREIERDFCDPSNVYSRGVQPVYFDTMTRGPTQVRRLSTVSSVVQPNFILTTTWAWFWQDEHNNWIQYSSVEGQHGLSSITSEDLERKYQEDSRAVMEFTAGSQTYKFSFPGSYFAEDTSYSHVFTGTSEVRTMFVCRVMVGYYMRGDSVLYNSCVDNEDDPSIFVVFEKHQVYPEYILKYGEDMRLSSAGAMETVTSLGLNSTQSARCASTLPTMTQNPKAKRPVTANSVTPKPVQAPLPVSASSVTPKPVPAPRLVSASSVTPKPVQAPPPVSASSVTPEPVQAPPPVSASSVTLKPVQAPPPGSASSVTPKPLKVPPPVRPRSVTLKPTQAPPPFTTSSVTSRGQALVEMFDPYWGQSSGSTGTASSPSDSSDGTYSQTPTSASPPTSFPGDGYSPSTATGTSSQSGSTSAMDGSRNEDGSYGAFIRRSGLDPK